MRNNWKKKTEELAKQLHKKDYELIKAGDKTHKHQFTNYDLTSEDGIAFCDWKCECGCVVSQCLCERIPPEAIPTDKSSWSEY